MMKKEMVWMDVQGGLSGWNDETVNPGPWLEKKGRKLIDWQMVSVEDSENCQLPVSFSINLFW
jgi:hypothetical protein